MALPVLMSYLPYLPGLTRQVARLTFVLARLFDPNFTPCGVFMSNKVVFELMIVSNNFCVSTALRMVDSQSIKTVDKLIRMKCYGLRRKSSFMVRVINHDRFESAGVGLPVVTVHSVIFGGELIQVIPFYLKNGTTWIVNQELVSSVGLELSPEHA
jgi:hypothetical protein